MEFNEAFTSVIHKDLREDPDAVLTILALNRLIQRHPDFPNICNTFINLTNLGGLGPEVISSAIALGFEVAQYLRDNPATDTDGLPSGNTELYFLERLNQLQDPRPHDPGSKITTLQIPSVFFDIYPTLELLQTAFDTYFEYSERIELKELTYSNGN